MSLHLPATLLHESHFSNDQRSLFYRLSLSCLTLAQLVRGLYDHVQDGLSLCYRRGTGVGLVVSLSEGILAYLCNNIAGDLIVLVHWLI